jgi:NADH dehydrogenase FAD-containing subunit
VVLVHSGKQILEREVGPKLSAYAQRKLQSRGVEMCLENRLVSATPDAAILSGGVRIATCKRRREIVALGGRKVQRPA